MGVCLVAGCVSEVLYGPGTRRQSPKGLKVLGLALVAYGLADDDRVHAARSMRSAFHGFAHLESGDGHPHPVDLDESFDRLVDLLCAGIHQMAGVAA